MKPHRFKIYGLIVAILLLFIVGCGDSTSNDGNDTLSDTGTVKYAGIYYQYKNTLGTMQILVETDVGVNDDDKHRGIQFEHPSSCNEPNWSYRHYDYDFWSSENVDHPGIPNKQDRRLFVIDADNLSPDCFYDVNFKYRDTIVGEWHETWGHFHSTPLTDGFDPSKTASCLEFYALGDTRITDDTTRDHVDDVFEAMWGHSGKKTFFLHSGDIVWNGGSPVGCYLYADSGDNKGTKGSVHNNDSWYKTFLGHNDDLSHVWEVLRHMPMFPVVGNHDIQVNARNDGNYYHWLKPNEFIGSINPNISGYNYHHYFGEYSHNNLALPEHQYWFRAYGPLLIWGLTAYPMENPGDFCDPKNKNFRSSEMGGTGQYEWLKASLEKHAGDVRQWKIVMLHTPIYDPDDGCNNQVDAQTYLTPLFDKYGVDLVLTGHEHFYARKTVKDIPYLILGGGGAGLGLSTKCQEDPYCNGFDLVKNKHHFGYFRIEDDVMECSIIGTDSKNIDSFTIDRTPKANFDVVPKESAVAPVTVKFSDTSTGNRYKYEWNFGDGQTSEGTGIDASTEHTYTAKRNYTIILTITSATGSNTKTCTDCVYVGPIADFDGTPLEGDIPLTVQFQDKSEGDVRSWLWDFGDGNTSVEQNPVHIYQKNGRHSVKLTVSDNDISNTKTRSKYVKVLPWADFTPLFRNCGVEDCIDSCGNRFENLSRGDYLTYHWDFGDGSTSTLREPTHYFYIGSDCTAGNTYTVQLTITDDVNGLTDSETGYFTVYVRRWP